MFFSESFKDAIIKMGNIGVLTRSQGEIRKQWNFVNSKSTELDINVIESIDSLEEDGIVSSI